MKTQPTLFYRLLSTPLFFCVPILIAAMLFASCRSSDDSQSNNPRKPKNDIPADVATLFRNGYAMCKLDVLANEGVAAIAAHGSHAEADATATEVSGMSNQASQIYLAALLRLKKTSRRIVEIEVGRQYRLQADPRAAALVQPVILRHIDTIFLGNPLSASDIRQDFESQRYRAYVPVN